MDNISLRGKFTLKDKVTGDVVFENHNLVVYQGYNAIAAMVGAVSADEELSGSFQVRLYSGGSNAFLRTDTSVSGTLQASAGVASYDLDSTNHSVILNYTVSASSFNGTTTLTTAALFWDGKLFSEVDLGDLTHEANTEYVGTWEIIFGDDTIPVGNGTASSPYLIANATQLDWFRSQVNGGSNSIHGALISNITYNAGMDVQGWDGKSSNKFTEFTPIAPNSTGYKGTFDGRGNTISGLFINKDDSPWCGLFGNVASAGVVKNVTIRNSYISTSHSDAASVCIGGIVGYNYGTVSGCDVSATIDAKSDLSGIDSSTIRCGGIVGGYSSGTVSGCTSSGSVDVSGTATSYIYCGGIVGGTYSSGTVSGCTSSGSVDVSGTTTTNIYCGGIVGGTGYSSGTVSGCTSSGSVDVSGTATTIRCGGIVGILNNIPSGSTVTVSDNKVYGSVDVSGTATTIQCGGIIGYRWQDTDVYVYENYFYGSYTVSGSGGTVYTGAIIGGGQTAESDYLYDNYDYSASTVSVAALAAASVALVSDEDTASVSVASDEAVTTETTEAADTAIVVETE